MIEKLKKVDDSEYPYLDENGVSHRSKKGYLQTGVLGFCGCASPDDAMLFVRDLLKLIKEEKGWNKEIKKHLPTDGAYYFVLYMFDHLNLTEHGGSVDGSYLTDKGKEVLADIEWCLENEKDL